MNWSNQGRTATKIESCFFLLNLLLAVTPSVWAIDIVLQNGAISGGLRYIAFRNGSRASIQWSHSTPDYKSLTAIKVSYFKENSSQRSTLYQWTGFKANADFANKTLVSDPRIVPENLYERGLFNVVFQTASFGDSGFYELELIDDYVFWQSESVFVYIFDSPTTPQIQGNLFPITGYSLNLKCIAVSVNSLPPGSLLKRLSKLSYRWTTSSGRLLAEGVDRLVVEDVHADLETIVDGVRCRVTEHEMASTDSPVENIRVIEPPNIGFANDRNVSPYRLIAGDPTPYSVVCKADAPPSMPYTQVHVTLDCNGDDGRPPAVDASIVGNNGSAALTFPGPQRSSPDRVCSCSAQYSPAMLRIAATDIFRAVVYSAPLGPLSMTFTPQQPWTSPGSIKCSVEESGYPAVTNFVLTVLNGDGHPLGNWRGVGSKSYTFQVLWNEQVPSGARCTAFNGVDQVTPTSGVDSLTRTESLVIHYPPVLEISAFGRVVDFSNRDLWVDIGDRLEIDCRIARPGRPDTSRLYWVMAPNDADNQVTWSETRAPTARPAEKSDAGIYECRSLSVANAPQTAFKIVLHIRYVEARVVVVNDNRTTVSQGQVVLSRGASPVFSCEINAVPEVSADAIEWFSGHKRVADANDPLWRDHFNGQISPLVPASPESIHMSTLRCGARGVRSTPLRILVSYPPKFNPSESSPNTHLTLGSTSRLIAIFDGFPRPSISWHLMTQPPVLLEPLSDGTLDVPLTKLRRLDATKATIKCVATNALGQAAINFDFSLEKANISRVSACRSPDSESRLKLRVCGFGPLDVCSNSDCSQTPVASINSSTTSRIRCVDFWIRPDRFVSRRLFLVSDTVETASIPTCPSRTPIFSVNSATTSAIILATVCVGVLVLIGICAVCVFWCVSRTKRRGGGRLQTRSNGGMTSGVSSSSSSSATTRHITACEGRWAPDSSLNREHGIVPRKAVPPDKIVYAKIDVAATNRLFALSASDSPPPDNEPT